jgi:hypothetical protein
MPDGWKYLMRDMPGLTRAMLAYFRDRAKRYITEAQM